NPHPPPPENPAPSAASENALHRPSEASPRCRLKSRNSPGVDITVTPPANARSHSPERNPRPARCNATSADEHAVSTVTAGPSRPSVYDTRPDITLAVL